MAGSFQNEIPAARINLKLNVGKGNAKKKMELPLKTLVVGDYSFKKRDTRVAERESVAVNKHNFTQVMESMNLQLCYQVDNKLSGEGSLDVNLAVRDMNSFHPERIAKSIPALGRLLAARNLIKDLKSNLLDNREFRKRLEEIIRNREATRALQAELQKLIPEQLPAAS